MSCLSLCVLITKIYPSFTVCSSSSISFFFFYCFAAPRDLHSFPTRRSSDLLGTTRLMLDSPAAQDGRLKGLLEDLELVLADRKSTRLNSSHTVISYAVFCLKKKNRRDGTSSHRKI